jgi:hypothetical protein
MGNPELQRSLTIDDFSGYVALHSGSTPGDSIDIGAFFSAYRPAGFLMDSQNKPCAISGISLVAQLFNETTLNTIHGLHYWRSGSCGSSLILATSAGIYRSRTKRSGDSTTPYYFKFDALTQSGPTAKGLPTVVLGGVQDVFGCFAEYRDSLYYCNGVDWPIRINSLAELFNGSTIYFYPMGVFDPSLASDVGVVASVYTGIRSSMLGVDNASIPTYWAALTGVFGDSPLVFTGPIVSDGNGAFPVVSLSTVASWWKRYGVTGIKIYRLPSGATIPQYLTTMGLTVSAFTDGVDDGALGVPPPTDVGLPSRFRLLQAFEDRLFAIGGFGRENRCACSQSGYPDQWPPLFEIPLHLVLGSDRVTRLAVINGSLYAFATAMILRLYGSSPENYRFSVVSNFVGCEAPRTLFPWQDGVVFKSRDGLYFFNGTNLRKITGFLDEELLRKTQGTLDWAFACGAVNGDQYLLSVRCDDQEKELATAVAGTDTNRTFWINMITGKVGLQEDWAFTQSTPYDGVNSLVIGRTVL